MRRIDLLKPIMEARLDLCASKGFDSVDPDNLDGYTNDTGFPLTQEDQITFNAWLAEAAHARGLAVSLKDAPELLPDLLPYFDFTVVEDCFAQDWCAEMQPFITAGKQVFTIEYTDNNIQFWVTFCP